MNEKRFAIIVGNDQIRSVIAENVREFFEILELGDVDEANAKATVLADSLALLFVGIDKPNDEGMTFIRCLYHNKLIRRIPVVVFSPVADKKTERTVYEMGAAEYVTVPFDAEILQIKLRNIIGQFRYKSALDYERLQRINDAIDNHENTIDFLANVIEARNMENGEHVSRVKGFTRILGRQVMQDYPEYGLDEKKVNLIASASALHDLGKIMIRESVLLKPGKLTPEETEYMQTHTICGCVLLNKMKNMLFDDFYQTSYDICRSHHEKVDGSGYPDGLIGDEIPLSAQIVSVADCYDALTAERVYKQAFSVETAFHMILSGECGAFSERLMNSFRKCKARFEELAGEGGTI